MATTITVTAYKFIWYNYIPTTNTDHHHTVQLAWVPVQYLCHWPEGKTHAIGVHRAARNMPLCTGAQYNLQVLVPVTDCCIVHHVNGTCAGSKLVELIVIVFLVLHLAPTCTDTGPNPSTYTLCSVSFYQLSYKLIQILLCAHGSFNCYKVLVLMLVFFPATSIICCTCTWATCTVWRWSVFVVVAVYRLWQW